MKKIPANSNDATTGHTLQRMSKEVIPAISTTNIIHGQNKKIRERHAGETTEGNFKIFLVNRYSVFHILENTVHFFK